MEIYGYDFMEQTHGLADIEPNREENYPEVNVTVDREKAALLGTSETDVANAVLFSLNGQAAARNLSRIAVCDRPVALIGLHSHGGAEGNRFIRPS